MKKAELTSLRTKEVKELILTAREKKLEAMKMVANMHAGKESNLKAVKKLRRDIAQILTIVEEKRLMAKEDAMKEAEKL